MKTFKYIYGPVASWRLGDSLGVDLLSGEDKLCTFDCTYCQIGAIRFYTAERQIFVPTEDVIKEIKSIPEVHIDYITFSGRGEPTLAGNLGEVIKEIKKIRKEPIAVLTNSSLMPKEDVREELLLSDVVACKIDASSEDSLLAINRPAPGIHFENIIEGIIEFRKMYKKKLALQVMFTKKNKNEAGKIADIAFKIKPDEIHINTPLRKPKEGALSEPEVNYIKKYFKPFNVISVYDAPFKRIKPINAKDTLKRRPRI